MQAAFGAKRILYNFFFSICRIICLQSEAAPDDPDGATLSSPASVAGGNADDLGAVGEDLNLYIVAGHEAMQL